MKLVQNLFFTEDYLTSKFLSPWIRRTCTRLYHSWQKRFLWKIWSYN